MAEKRVGSGLPGPGRPKGSRNKNTKDVAELAQKHGPAAIAKLAQIAKNDKHAGQVAAIKELLDRAYGRPSQAVTADLSGEFRITWVNGD